MQSRRFAPAWPLLMALLALTVLAPSGVYVPSVQARPSHAPAAAPGSGKIQIENLDGIPYNDRLVFQRINTGYSKPTHKTVTLRIKNVDATPLTVASLAISGGDATSFKISSADASGFTLASGESRDVVVNFVAGTNGNQTGNNGNQKGQRLSTLFIQSSDGTTPTLPVQLAGFNMVTDSGLNEPPFQDILDTFGYTTHILNPNEGQSLHPQSVQRDPNTGAIISYTFVNVGDEIYSPFWVRADGNRPTYVRQLAAFSGSSSSPAQVCVSGTCVAHGSDQIQSFLPYQGTAGALGNPVELTTNPSTNQNNPFVISAAGQRSDRDPAQGRGVRFWPARDRSGALIPNTYIFGEDAIGNSQTNYDYQDNVYIITNVRPANQAIDPNQVAPAPGNSSLILDFNRTYAGTLTDKDGEGTGFAETQRNKNDITAPDGKPSTSYDRTRLDLNTGGQGTLTIKTSGGSNSGTDNSLVNGLCAPFDGRSGKFAISTRLVGPLTTFATAFQQGGVMFGPSQGSFLKLTAGVQASGSSAGKPWIQFVQETDNVATQIGDLLSIPSPATVTTLDLQLTADATTGKVEASYRINGGIAVALPNSVTISGAAYGRFFDVRAKGCVLALHKNATEINVAFDRFAVEPVQTATNLPTVSAGPDQKVPLNAAVTLNGTATDVNGTALTGTWEQVSGSRTVTLNGSGNTRTFTAPSSYSELTFAFAATDSQGRSASDTVTIIVGDEPIGGLSITSNSPVELGSPVRLAASTTAGSQPITYEWNFGDGSAPVSGGPVIKHTYAALGQYNATVTARNAANTATAQTAVTVQPVVPAFAFRYDVGAPNSKSTVVNGVTWKSDNGLYSPSAPSEKRPQPPEIANTTDDVIYQTYRGKVTTDPKILTFEFPINSQIGLADNVRVVTTVRLHFAEIYWGGSQGVPNEVGAGKRIFDVLFEGAIVLDNFDIAATAGGSDKALIEEFKDVVVNDGKLTVALRAVKDYPSLAGIEILSAPKAPPENNAPSANAGADQTVAAGTQVTLAGSGSDPDGDALTYSWQQTSGPAVALGGSDATRTFTPTSPGSYIFTLTATDPGGLSGADTVVITVNDTTQPPDSPPTADAGPDQTSLIGLTITLRGSGTDPNGDAITYRWQQTGGPAVALGGNDGDAVRTFTPTGVGSYIFTLTTTDTRGLSGADTVVITIVDTPPLDNEAPTANAGENQTVSAGSVVTLRGGTSNDPEGNPLNYRWQQTGGTAVTLSDSTAAEPTFVAPSQLTTLTFQLVVTDNFGVASTPDEVQVTVVAGPVGAPQLRVFLPIVAK